MTSDDERREVARRLREYVNLPDDWWQETSAEFYVEKCVFGNVDRHSEAELFTRLADLIDPTCEVHRDTLFYPATDLTEEHEEAVFRCSKCEEIVSFDADYDPETDLPAYCERCGSRITVIGEPWDE